MTRVEGSRLMFDENQVRTTRALIPRLIRIIFFGFSITNNDYIARYQHHNRVMYGNKPARDASQKMISDRKSMQNKNSLTFKMFSAVLTAMGLDIEAITVRLRDRVTGDTRTFSTDDTVDTIIANMAKEKTTGFDSLLSAFSDGSDENPVATPEIKEGASRYTVLEIGPEPIDPSLEANVIGWSVEEALKLHLESSFRSGEATADAKEALEYLKDKPAGTVMVGSKTKTTYLVVEIKSPQ